MIDEDVFAREWEVLKERFDREASDEMMGRYYDLISAELEEEEFLQGVDRVYYENRFWPTPKEIVDAGRGADLARESEREWSRILTMREAQSRKEGYPEEEQRPNAAALKALRQIGGMEALRNASATQFRRYRRAFLEAYEALRPRPAAPSLPRGYEPAEMIEAEASG